MIREDVIYDSAEQLEQRAGMQDDVMDDTPQFLLPETAQRYRQLLAEGGDVMEENVAPREENYSPEEARALLADIFAESLARRADIARRCRQEEWGQIVSDGEVIRSQYSAYCGNLPRGDIERRIVKYRERYFLCFIWCLEEGESVLSCADDVADFNARELRAIDENRS